MSNDLGLDHALKRARERTTAELLYDLGKYPNPQRTENIAANIVLQERKTKQEEEREAREIERHQQMGDWIQDLKRLHWTAWILFVCGVASLTITLMQLNPAQVAPDANKPHPNDAALAPAKLSTTPGAGK